MFPSHDPKLWMLKFHGALGHEATAEETVTMMQADLGMRYAKSVTVGYNLPHQPIMAIGNTKPTGGAFVGPSAYVSTADG